MSAPHILGIIFALASAASWGTGDFSGGFATRTKNQFQVLFLMTVPGIVMLGFIALVIGEPFPAVKDILWASSAGLCGAFGIAALYRGLSLGSSAVVAPAAAVIGAGFPVGFSSLSIGLPEASTMLGFLTAIAGIWLVTRTPDGHPPTQTRDLVYAATAGLCFGGYFVLIAQVELGLVYAPLTCAKSASLIVAVIVLISRRDRIPSPASSPAALLAGIFDAFGNAFYLLARQYTRLDTAAVLASMYPAVTVILACLILKEKVSPSQWRGIALYAIAAALITA